MSDNPFYTDLQLLMSWMRAHEDEDGTGYVKATVPSMYSELHEQFTFANRPGNSHYLFKRYLVPLEEMGCIQIKQFLADAKRMRFPGDDDASRATQPIIRILQDLTPEAWREYVVKRAATPTTPSARLAAAEAEIARLRAELDEARRRQ